MPTEREDQRADLLVIEKEVHLVVRSEGPELKVERKWGHDWYVGTDSVCGVFGYQRHVGVEFWRGTSLPDPNHLLEGRGKNLRHVTLHSVADVQSPAFHALVRAAISIDRDSPKRPR
jgi:hypothetical protein